MQLKKVLTAGSMGLLMAGSSLAFAATLGDYPSPFVTSDDGVQSFVVVGANADPQDVVGAIDIAARLGGALTTEKTLSGATTAITLSGKSEEISLGYNVTAEAGAFPQTMKSHHIPALDGAIKIPWEYQTDGEMDAHEEFVLGFVNMSRNPATYNGTIYMQVPDPTATTQQANASAFYYKYVFDETMEGPGNMSSVKPLSITLLGTTFDITAIPTTNKIKAMTGDQLDISFGESGETSSGFTITPTAYTSDGYWYVKVEKGDASQEKKLLVGSSTDTEYTVGGEAVKVRVISNITKTVLEEGSEVTKKIVSVAAGTTTEIVYNQQSSTTLGTATDGNNTFPGTDSKWRFEFSIGTAGQFSNNDYIAVYYDPWNSDDSDESAYNGNPLNLTVGEKISIPSDAFDVQFAAMNTETFATITMERELVNIYWNGTTDTSSHWSQRPAIKLTTTGGTFVSGTAIDKNTVWIVYNTTRDLVENSTDIVYLGTKDSSGYLRNDVTIKNLSRTAYQSMFTLDYGDYPNTMTVYGVNSSNVNDVYTIQFTDYLGDTVKVNVTVNASATSTNDRIYIGDGLSDDAGSTDVVVNGTAVARVYRDYYTAYGVKVEDIEGNAKSDRAVLKAPLTQIKGIVAVGSDVSVGGTTSTYTDATPITTAIGMLDSDFQDTEKSTKNAIIVGGPCANALVAALASNLEYENTTLTCANWNALSAGGDKFGIIQLVEDAWATGTAALVVAGSTAKETLEASKILLDYESYASSLADKSAVVVRGTTVTEIS